jgi:hypothetical protein
VLQLVCLLYKDQALLEIVLIGHLHAEAPGAPVPDVANVVPASPARYRSSLSVVQIYNSLVPGGIWQAEARVALGRRPMT